ncbi:hypothetical protein CC79DRAFT_476271 [Sarocladium strictum]
MDFLQKKKKKKKSLLGIGWIDDENDGPLRFYSSSVVVGVEPSLQGSSAQQGIPRTRASTSRLLLFHHHRPPIDNIVGMSARTCHHSSNLKRTCTSRPIHRIIGDQKTRSPSKHKHQRAQTGTISDTPAQTDGLRLYLTTHYVDCLTSSALLPSSRRRVRSPN